MKFKIVSMIILISQLLIWLPLRLIFFFFGRLRVVGWNNIYKLPKRTFLMVSNHYSYLDTFLISHLFPFNWRYFPIRYPSDPEQYYSLKRPFMFILGAYPIFKGQGLDKSLQKSIDILEHAGRIMMFPEGKMQRVGRRINPRRGVSYLAAKCDVPILPCYIENLGGSKYNAGFSLINLFLRRYKMKVVIGKPFFLKEILEKLPSTDNEFREASQKIIDRVYGLKEDRI